MSYLRFITDYYDIFTEKCHGLLRVVTDNYEQLMGILRVFFTDCYEYITDCYYLSKLLRVSYDLFTCCY